MAFKRTPTYANIRLMKSDIREEIYTVFIAGGPGPYIFVRVIKYPT